jgi:thiol-disulfide isomerase/thioredoxin
MLKALVFLFINAILTFSVYASETHTSSEDLHEKVPPPLTLSNFDEILKSGFHVVEFYSPYCPHCNHLFPTWVEFYRSNQNQQQQQQQQQNQLDINEIEIDVNQQNGKFGIRQVDCVANGDLCDREGIYYYPMIRFYGPGSKLLGSMTDSHITVDTLNAFAEEQMIVWTDDIVDSNTNDNDNYNDNTKKSDLLNDFTNGEISVFNDNKMLDASEMLRIISGQNETPRIISFWPTTDEELNDKNFQNNFKENKIFKYFENLFTFRNIWNFVMKNLQTYVNDNSLHFNYFNCRSNKEICETLGFKDLTDGIFENTSPKVILYLPKPNGGNAIYYKRKITDFSSFNSAIKSLTHWTSTTLINSELQDMKFMDIVNFIGATTRLEDRGTISNILNYSKVAFIQVNDPSTEVPEDNGLLDYLLQPIADLNDDVYLFKTSDKDSVLKFLQDQEKQMANSYIHYQDKEEDKSLKYDEKLFISRTRSTFPMIICIKASSLYSPVYQSFMSKDIRDYNKVTKFINRNYLPIINHLNMDTKDIIFPKKMIKGIHEQTEKIIITLTDFQPKQFFDVEYFMSYVFHKFKFINNKHKLEKIEQLRAKKHEKVRKIKETTDDSDDIIEALREKIDISYNTPDNYIYPVYIDKKKFAYMVSRMHWNNINPENYDVGDAIIIERFSRHYWDHDIEDNKLTIEQLNECVDTLEKISFEKLKGKNVYKKSTVMLIFQFLLFAVGGYSIIRLFKRWKLHKSHNSEKMKGLGLLGVPDIEVAKFD